MAGEHFAVQRHLRALKRLLPLVLVEIAVDVVGIDKGDFHRNRIQQPLELIQLQVAARHHDFTDKGRAAALCLGRIDRNLYLLLLCRRLIFLSRLIDLAHDAEAVLIVLGIAVNLLPLILREIHGTNREENVGLLVNHLVRALHDSLCRRLPGVVLDLCLIKAPQLIADFIVHRPHHGGRTRHIIFYL